MGVIVPFPSRRAPVAPIVGPEWRRIEGRRKAAIAGLEGAIAWLEGPFGPLVPEALRPRLLHCYNGLLKQLIALDPACATVEEAAVLTRRVARILNASRDFFDVVEAEIASSLP